jgi:conjugal transfer/entry exclusion protein
MVRKVVQMKIVNSQDPFDAAWHANYIKFQIEKIDELLKKYPESDTYKYVRSVWVERLAKYESRV